MSLRRISPRFALLTGIILTAGVTYASLGITTSIDNNVMTIQKIQVQSGALPTAGWKVEIGTGGIKLKLPNIPNYGVLKRAPSGYVVQGLVSGSEISSITNIQINTGAITSGLIATGTLQNNVFASGSITCEDLAIAGMSCTGALLTGSTCPLGQVAYGVSSTGALMCTSTSCSGTGCTVPNCLSGEILTWNGGLSIWECKTQLQNNSGSSLREPTPVIGDIRNRNFNPGTLAPLLSGNFIGNVGVGLNNPSAVLHVRNTFLTQHAGGNAYPNTITAIQYSGSGNTGSLVTAAGGCFITGSVAIPNANYVFYATGGRVGILTRNPQYTLDVVGQIRAITVLTLSDKRLKTDIMLINSPLSLLQSIHGYTYTLDIDGSQNYGLIAQEIEKTLPHAVQTDEHGYKSVDYQALIAPTIEAIRALDTKTSQLENLTKENNTRLKKLTAQ